MIKVKLFTFLLVATIIAFSKPANSDTIDHIPIIPAIKVLSNPHKVTQVNCLAENMYHEAKNQGIKGMKAVGLVTMNRRNHEKFPDTVCQVVKQRNSRACQFSWVCQNVSIDYASMEYQLAVKLAISIYTNSNINDFTNGALFFHANYVKPYWRKHYQKTVVINDHVFYTLKGKL